MNVTAAEQFLHLFALYLFFYREKSDALLLLQVKSCRFAVEKIVMLVTPLHVRFKSFSQTGFHDLQLVWSTNTWPSVMPIISVVLGCWLTVVWCLLYHINP